MLTTRLVDVVRRRWVTVLVGVALTAGLAFATVKLVPPDQTVTATVLILPPSTPTEGGAGKTNPYLQLGGLTSPTEILARALNDPKVHEQIVKPNTDGDYIAERDLTTSAPVMLVTGEAPTVTQARRIVNSVLAVTPQVLTELQSSIGVPAASQLTSDVLSPEGRPAQKSKTLIRTMLVVTVAGLALTLAVAGALDALLSRRTRHGGRRTKRAAVADDT